MIKRFSKICTAVTFVAVMLFNSNSTNAQLSDIEAFLDVLSEGEQNASVLTQAYLTPMATGLSTALNSGWTTTAAPTKKLGFSVQVRTALTAVPSSGQTFDASTIGLSPGITVSQGESNTISGAKGSGQTLTLPGGSQIVLPGGTGFEYVPAAMLQGNIGLIKGTDVTLRYIPETAIGDFGDMSMTGVGIKHGINQWLPAGKLLPVDISIMAAFSQTTLNADLDFNAGQDQRLETTTNTFVLNALVGKTLPFLSAYAGLGMQTGTFDLDMLGDYTIGSGALSETYTDPVSYSQDSDAAIHVLAGVQFKVAIFRIYAEATVAEYATYNIGVGIGLR
ncbi:MAG: DUF6588 family protein [Balneolaceae bacterium]